MWNAHVQDHGLQTLYYGLKSHNITITELELSCNLLTEVSSAAISGLVISCRVEVLSVSGNNIDGEDDKLYRMITDPTSMVKKLYMNNNNLSSIAAVKLFTALSEAKKLMVLWISNNLIGDEACDAITMALEKITSLISLNMYYNPISKECEQLIIQAFQQCKTLQWVCLNNYPIPEDDRSAQESNKKTNS